MEHKKKKVKYAVKKILKPTRREIEIGKQWKADWKTDVAKLTSLQSPVIVQTHDAFEDADAAYIVMEYCSKGDLRYLMCQRHQADQPFTESVSESFRIPSCIFSSFFSFQEVFRLAAQLVSGLAEIHAANIIHRDIKPGNVLVSDSDKLKIGMCLISFVSLQLFCSA
jgi:serine/threonine protein kinase